MRKRALILLAMAWSMTSIAPVAAAGDFDKAVALAKLAEAMAKASIAQAKEQQDAWRAAEIR